jgi:pSer/pThr/pTyr-binding forkhead associated (FHA) protein
MPPFVLIVLKVVFLALLYFFVYRTIRTVVVDARGTRPTRPSAAPPAPAITAAARVGGKGRPPRSVVVVDDRGKGQSYRLDGNVQIGRSDSCQIKLGDTYVSSHHAKIYNREGAWYVEDLGSTNGTYLNQRRITSAAELQAGDRLKMGKTVLELRR